MIDLHSTYDYHVVARVEGVAGTCIPMRGSVWFQGTDIEEKMQRNWARSVLIEEIKYCIISNIDASLI